MKYHAKLFLVIFTLLFANINLSNIFAANEIRLNYKNYEEKIADNKESEKKSKEVISITNDELYLLSKLVSSEARGESYEGQFAVAAVVINRVKDSRFPNNIKDVIYQKNAFSVVKTDLYI